MNVKVVLGSVLVLMMCLTGIRSISAKQKSLKIIIPSKIRYVHHHHTHVVVMKDKKHKERAPDAKFHHLHYYDDGHGGGGRKSKGVSHHYYLPYLPPPAEDDAEDESIAKYTIAPPKNRIYPKSNYASTRQLPPVYEDQSYPSYPRKYRFYDRNSEGSYTTPRSVMEYYEADPYFPVMINPVQEPEKSASTKVPRVEYRYNDEYLPHYAEEPDYGGGQLFYPEKAFYDSGPRFQHIY